MKRLLAVLVATAATLGIGVGVPAAAQASTQSCWSYTIETSITKLNVTQVSYLAKWHWCATDGKVTGFVVDKSYAVASGWTKNAGIDIQPFRPGEFGKGSYDIYVNAFGNQKVGKITISYNGNSVAITPGQYQDYYDVSLNGNGTVTGIKYKVR